MPRNPKSNRPICRLFPLCEFKVSDCIFACARIQLAPFFASILIDRPSPNF